MHDTNTGTKLSLYTDILIKPPFGLFQELYNPTRARDISALYDKALSVHFSVKALEPMSRTISIFV